MNDDRTVRRWHKAIIADAEKRPGRPLRDHERKFITSRGGFVASEMIHDTVRAAGRDEMESYLRSERRQKESGNTNDPRPD